MFIFIYLYTKTTNVGLLCTREPHNLLTQTLVAGIKPDYEQGKARCARVSRDRIMWSWPDICRGHEK